MTTFALQRYDMGIVIIAGACDYIDQIRYCSVIVVVVLAWIDINNFSKNYCILGKHLLLFLS